MGGAHQREHRHYHNDHSRLPAQPRKTSLSHPITRPQRAVAPMGAGRPPNGLLPRGRAYIGEYTSPAKAASGPTESRPEQCPRMEVPRHRGVNGRVHAEPIG